MTAKTVGCCKVRSEPAQQNVARSLRPGGMSSESPPGDHEAGVNRIPMEQMQRVERLMKQRPDPTCFPKAGVDYHDPIVITTRTCQGVQEHRVHLVPRTDEQDPIFV